MADKIAALGGALRTGARVMSLRTHRGNIAAIDFTDGTGAHELRCDAVVSTLSLPALARMLAGPAPPRTVDESASRLRFRAIRLCNVLLDVPQVSPHTWMYVSEARYLVARIQEPRHRSPAMTPAGRTSLMLEIPCRA